jgi:RNA polymerase sigma factor (sigma-70 family)
MQPDFGENTTIGVERCLQQLAAGRADSREQLIEMSSRRLRRLTQAMFRDHPSLARWEEADDVYQQGVIRLWQALRECRPETAIQYYRLAAQVLRRELIDLARHYFGPRGLAANHATPAVFPHDVRFGSPDNPADSTWDSARLQPWTDFHQEVESLPEELKSTFDLLWYQGLPQSEAAQVLNLSQRTLERRWHEARMEIYRRLNQ